VKIILLPMEAVTADQNADAIDVALTARTAPMASTATTVDIAKPKAKVKKGLTTTERDVLTKKTERDVQN
jgi:hypothetical protein